MSLPDGCKIKVRRAARSRDPTYTYTCRGDVLGVLDVGRADPARLCRTERALQCSRAFGRAGGSVRLVEAIDVVEAARRRGVATALYEAALRDACRAAEPLVSAYRVPWSFSNDFWTKQRKAGRAVVVGARHVNPHSDSPKKIPVYAIDCAKGTTLKGVKR